LASNMAIPSDETVVVRKGQGPREASEITVNCPDKVGLGCDLTRIMFEFGLNVVKGDLSTDGRWCFLVFWVVPRTRSNKPIKWSLLKHRLLAACPSSEPVFFSRPSHSSPASSSSSSSSSSSAHSYGLPSYGITSSSSYRPSSSSSALAVSLGGGGGGGGGVNKAAARVFLLQVQASDRCGLLNDMTQLLWELELTIHRVNVSTSPDGQAIDFFFVTDNRKELPGKHRSDQIIERVRDALTLSGLSRGGAKGLLASSGAPGTTGAGGGAGAGYGGRAAGAATGAAAGGAGGKGGRSGVSSGAIASSLAAAPAAVAGVGGGGGGGGRDGECESVVCSISPTTGADAADIADLSLGVSECIPYAVEKFLLGEFNTPPNSPPRSFFSSDAAARAAAAGGGAAAGSAAGAGVAGRLGVAGQGSVGAGGSMSRGMGVGGPGSRGRSQLSCEMSAAAAAAAASSAASPSIPQVSTAPSGAAADGMRAISTASASSSSSASTASSGLTAASVAGTGLEIDSSDLAFSPVFSEGLGPSQRPPSVARVTVDNGMSPAHSMLQIQLKDRKGLVYDCLRTLRDLNMQVSYGRIATTDDGICQLDMFVVDSNGRKVEGAAQQALISARLTAELERPLRIVVVTRGGKGSVVGSVEGGEVKERASGGAAGSGGGGKLGGGMGMGMGMGMGLGMGLAMGMVGMGRSAAAPAAAPVSAAAGRSAKSGPTVAAGAGAAGAAAAVVGAGAGGAAGAFLSPSSASSLRAGSAAAASVAADEAAEAELLVATPVECCGRGRPRVLFDMTLALRQINVQVFKADIARHEMGGRTWEVYRLILQDKGGQPIAKLKTRLYIADQVRNVLMG
ncbi:hypothetical protein CLOM_g2261, partial [Closterium sp. NIES-68]